MDEPSRLRDLWREEDKFESWIRDIEDAIETLRKLASSEQNYSGYVEQMNEKNRTLKQYRQKLEEVQKKIEGEKMKFTPRSAKKRLFVCCDGTWQDGINNRKPLTNVSRLARCVRDITEDGCLQIVYYDSGVGNGTNFGINNVDAATGRGISAKIREAYSFICHNYHSTLADTEQSSIEDPTTMQTAGGQSKSKELSGQAEIFLVGFSRGAFTAQCVASMIHQIGVLKKEGLEFLRDLYSLWAVQSRYLETAVARLEHLHLVVKPVEITACGVWDTVSSLGSPAPQLSPRPLNFIGNRVPPAVKFAFQALALDEHRPHFWPLVWAPPHPATSTAVEQCWFLGSHSDVGGGNYDTRLETLPLLWMVSKLDSLNPLHRMFDDEILLDYFVNPEYHRSRQTLKADIQEQLKKFKVREAIGNATNYVAQRFLWLAGKKRRGKCLKMGAVREDDEGARPNLTSCQRIHFTARLMRERKDGSRVLKNWTPFLNDDGHKWRHCRTKSVVAEDKLTDRERAFLERWIAISAMITESMQQAQQESDEPLYQLIRNFIQQGV